MGRKLSLSKLQSCLSLLTDCYISSVIGCNWCPAPGYGKADNSRAQTLLNQPSNSSATREASLFKQKKNFILQLSARLAQVNPGSYDGLLSVLVLY
jgi:hypothetical protein